mgnify:FL=1|jgi:hypothetical protein|tara:strand:- start:1581 stop:2255 length:675 start_codon:yes stop_codon:yes gene_type:complete
MSGLGRIDLEVWKEYCDQNGYSKPKKSLLKIFNTRTVSKIMDGKDVRVSVIRKLADHTNISPEKLSATIKQPLEIISTPPEVLANISSFRNTPKMPKSDNINKLFGKKIWGRSSSCKILDNPITSRGLLAITNITKVLFYLDTLSKPLDLSERIKLRCFDSRNNYNLSKLYENLTTFQSAIEVLNEEGFITRIVHDSELQITIKKAIGTPSSLFELKNKIKGQE